MESTNGVQSKGSIEREKVGSGLPAEVYLERIAKDMAVVREMLGKVIFYMVEAEAEVSEKMRRFMMYMHDVHDVTFLYEQRGLPIPEHINEELRRCHDRYRQLLKKAHTDGGTFEKVRAEMALDPKNTFNHAKELTHHRGET